VTSVGKNVHLQVKLQYLATITYHLSSKSGLHGDAITNFPMQIANFLCSILQLGITFCSSLNIENYD